MTRTSTEGTRPARRAKRARRATLYSLGSALLLGVALLAPGGGRTAVQAAGNTDKVQPYLAQQATSNPSGTVRVIVQMNGHDDTVSDRVKGLGGKMIKNVNLINGFVAEMPARALQGLAQAASVKHISVDAPVFKSSTTCPACVNTASLRDAYVQAVGADRLWNEGPAYLQGQGVAVAVVDSGVSAGADLQDGNGNSRVKASMAYTSTAPVAADDYGHGSHVAGIIAGNGNASGGAYVGVAPQANLVNVRIADKNGMSYTSDVVNGLEWVYNNRAAYNIRVVNLSLNATVDESYTTNALDAAVETLWLNKVVVVVSSGNSGPGHVFPPANDPFVITVGAANDMGTPSIGDDAMAPFSTYGTTFDGFAKPDVVAPGVNIISLLAGPGSSMATKHSDHMANGFPGASAYFRLSGTSMAAPVVAGAAALLLQSNPSLTPDQVKYRFMATARPFATSAQAGAGYLDAYGAVHGTTTASANTGLVVSPQVTLSGGTGGTWNSATWGSATWGSSTWGSSTWGSSTSSSSIDDWSTDDWSS